eukprot:scaffold2456_cov238-Pinguiococcus_pyrenoidosus.AAC.1
MDESVAPSSARRRRRQGDREPERSSARQKKRQEEVVPVELCLALATVCGIHARVGKDFFQNCTMLRRRSDAGLVNEIHELEELNLVGANPGTSRRRDLEDFAEGGVGIDEELP